MRRTLAICAGVLLLLAAPAQAQTRLEVRVTSVADRSVYIDAGRDAGVKPDMIVVFYKPFGIQVRAVVRDVSANNARAELIDGQPVPAIGVRGEIILPPAPAVPDQQPPTEDKPPPEHPPWKRAETDRDTQMPLLAPAYARKPQDKPTEVKGRVFALLRYTQDRGGNRTNTYTFGRVGARLEVTNPFHRGGTVEFAGSIDQRGTDANGFDSTDRNLIIKRLSYRHGGQEYAPYRLEVGRFYSVFVPEIGLVDGAEAAMQFQNGLQLGAGAGSYPEPFPDLKLGQDYGVHVFANYQASGKSMLSSGVAYQQTWHDGAPDRNLLIGRINARPTETLWVYGLALVDIYTDSDQINGQGLKLTQGIAQLRFTPGRIKGAQLTYTRITFPELKRDDFAFLPNKLIRDGYIDRINVSGWYRVTERVRLTGRANMWRDQNDTGRGLEASADFNDVWRDTSALHAALYYTEGSFIEGVGTRLQIRERLGYVNVSAGYDTFFYTTRGLVRGDESLARHTLRADVNWSRGRWYYSVNSSYTIGDREKQVSLGALVEYRF